MNVLWLAFIGVGFGVVLSMALNLLTAERILRKISDEEERAEESQKPRIVKKFHRAKFFLSYVQPLLIIVLSAFAATRLFGAE
ncbi:MAG TPA: hypothetical protein ENK61_05990 [Devosia sp.]|nr:hypothetical protein [Devosia sp.]